MKVPVLIEFSDEIMASISLDDIISAIAEEVDSDKTVLCGLNNVATFLRAIPDEIIIKYNDNQRKMIGEFLRDQSKRYSSNGG